MSDDASITSKWVNMIRMTVDIVAAYVSHNSLPAASIPELIQTVHGALGRMNGSAAATSGPGEAARPAVPIKKSITPEHLICLEDGKKMKMLKRHLRTTYGLTPEAYRIKWGLPSDYPMVAPNYAEQRSTFAKKIGLGRKPGVKNRRK